MMIFIRFVSLEMRLVYICAVCVFALLITHPGVYALTPKEEKGVKVLKAPSLVYESPDWFTPFSLEDAPQDLAYWLSILPYEEDKNEFMYMVMPTLGLITPIVQVPENSQDFVDMVNGREIEINNYLIEGVMHYPNSGLPGQIGNPVVFGHSNFFRNGDGKYKTIFADIMNLDVDIRDEIWVYIRESDGVYDLRKFAIEQSYETYPENVDILRPIGGKELTVFACTNGLEGRRILRGRLIENDEVLVPYPTKFRVADIKEGLEQADEELRQSTIVTGMQRIKVIRDEMPTANLTYDDKFKQYLLNYIEKKLAEHY